MESPVVDTGKGKSCAMSVDAARIAAQAKRVTNRLGRSGVLGWMIAEMIGALGEGEEVLG